MTVDEASYQEPVECFDLPAQLANLHDFLRTHAGHNLAASQHMIERVAAEMRKRKPSDWLLSDASASVSLKTSKDGNALSDIVDSSSTSDAEVLRMLEACMATSVRCACEALWTEKCKIEGITEREAEPQRREFAGALYLFAEDVPSRILEPVTLHMVPAFSKALGKSESAYGIQPLTLLHTFVADKLLPWMDRQNHLDLQVARAMGACDALQVALTVHLERYTNARQAATGVEEGFVPWNIKRNAQKLYDKWSRAQQRQVRDSCKRLLSKEQWHGKDTLGNATCASAATSCVELQRYCGEWLALSSEMMQALESSLTTSQMTLVLHAFDLVTAVIQRYAKVIVADMPSAATLAPEPPPLERYKQKNLVEACNERARKAQKHARKRVEKVAANRGASTLGSTIDPELQGTMSVTNGPGGPADPTSIHFDECVCKLNSLLLLDRFLQDRHTDLQQKLAQLDDGEECSFMSVADSDESTDERLPGPRGDITEALEALISGREQLCSLIAHYSIHSHMEPLFANLYVLDVGDVDVAPSCGANLAACEQLSHEAALILELVVASGAADVMSAWLSQVVDAFRSVLLDGGSFRFFSVGDADIIQRDVDDLETTLLRVAARAGVAPDAAWRGSFADIRVILVDMRRSTPALIEDHGLSKSMGRSNDADRLLHVLAHRKERPASKYLKSLEQAVPKVQGLTFMKGLKQRLRGSQD